jgi:hypothetical protein
MPVKTAQKTIIFPKIEDNIAYFSRELGIEISFDVFYGNLKLDARRLLLSF